MANLTATPLNTYSENIVASITIATVGMLGLVSNSCAILAARYNPALRNSFGLLCFSQCISNMGVLLIFVFWAAPTTIL
ncbi:hypothetical protein KIN20_024645 [Parelaphostrongylus tenuis]|uniref:7TM GPCR serpentine receptor class x (Srx) domain-containing protein n=1 Tax=Parelaphostrongylus tenuis TaxID=148309 RepID=A0AAD5QWE6_PARTN|nr:hypothetical protein KIN20_024645 [Parelaphostrongylus tenuis]